MEVCWGQFNGIFIAYLHLPECGQVPRACGTVVPSYAQVVAGVEMRTCESKDGDGVHAHGGLA